MTAARSSKIDPGQSDPVDSPFLFDFHYNEQTGGFNFVK